MLKTQGHSYPDTPFSVETETVENGPGIQASSKISIFRDDILIGEYLRNSPNFAALTFYPFEIGGEWYALYSANHTTTRVMKLHGTHIEDWCGETELSLGLSPVEFYVPKYKNILKHYYTDCDYTDDEFEYIKYEGVSTEYCNFGFLCGSENQHDDHWKIRYIDLSSVPDRTLNITQKFGYWEMPTASTLKDCVEMTEWSPTFPVINLARINRINLLDN